MKKCKICMKERDEMWFDWDKEKCMECVLDEVDD